MEYLNSTTDSLKHIDEKNIQYLDIFKHPSLVYGITDTSDKLNFSKYSLEVQKDIKKYYPEINSLMHYYKTASCGCRIRFKTNSKRIVLKVQLRRGYNYKNMVMWNSSGFTLYIYKNNKYGFHSLITPRAGSQCFAKEVILPANSSVCIFLPNFDTIKSMYIGFQKGSTVKSFHYPKDKRSPIIFYGGSTAQGASASKSSNSYPNIVSKKLNHDIINFSSAHCCKATLSMAKQIGKINCDSIIIDYSSDVSNKKELELNYETFYKKIRFYHPHKKIILMTTASFNGNKKYDGFDEIIQQTYENAISNGENTYLINQKELFDVCNYDLISYNEGHYTDYAMFKIANKICELLNL